MKKNIDIISRIHNYVLNKFPKKYAFKTKNQKYNLKLIINEIIYFIQSGVSYRHYRGPLNAKTLNKHILFFSKHQIFYRIYKQLLNEYINIKSYTKLKYQSIDTSFIMNKNGKQNIGRNKYFKNKMCYKLSFIVDSNGIPNSVSVNPGNINDAKIGISDIDNIIDSIKDINTKIIPYMLADKMYDTCEFRSKCVKHKFKPLIDYNRRNTKNNKLIKSLTPIEKKIYNKRIKVENTFCLIKKFKRLYTIYDSYMSTYKSFVFLALCLMINKYI